jgi:hypothetical protein
MPSLGPFHVTVGSVAIAPTAVWGHTFPLRVLQFSISFLLTTFKGAAVNGFRC